MYVAHAQKKLETNLPRMILTFQIPPEKQAAHNFRHTKINVAKFSREK